MRKFLSNILLFAVAIAAIALAKPIGSWVAEQLRGSPSGPSLEASFEAAIDSMLERPPIGDMYKALKAYFPEDAAYFRSRFRSLLLSDASSEEAFAQMAIVGEEIRRKHAPNLAKAPDQSLQSILQMQIQAISAFENNPELCNRIILYGPTIVPEEERARLVSLLDSASVLYRAMYEGQESPVERTASTDDDWSLLIADFFAQGGTEAQLELIFEPNIQNQDLCGAMLRFLRVLWMADFPGAHRVRAEMVAEINKG